jgi:hypothetical protein
MNEIDVTQILGSIAEAKKSADALRADTLSRITEIEKAIASGMNPDRLFGDGYALAKTIGSRFLDSDVWKSSPFASLTPDASQNAIANATVRFDLPAADVIKAITTGATGVPDKTRMPGIVPVEPDYPTPLLFTRVRQGQMTGGALEYTQDTTPPWDSSVPPTAEGNAKPEVTATFALKTVTPRTIAHWLAASKQILADAAALRSYLDGRLLRGLALKLEWQTLHGNGTGTNFAGLLAAAPTHAYTAGDDAITTIRKAIAACEASGWIVDTVGLHPVDFAFIQSLRGETNDHYLYADPARSGTSGGVLWGKRIVTSPVLNQGTYLLGDYQNGAELWTRENASVQAGFQNDDFTRNLVTLLAELRADLAIYSATAFRKGAFA